MFSFHHYSPHFIMDKMVWKLVKIVGTNEAINEGNFSEHLVRENVPEENNDQKISSLNSGTIWQVILLKK